MSEPLALQKVEELRSVVSDDSDVAELVDTLATLMVLKQDVTNPMLGAKVMFWEKPPGEWVDIDWEDYCELHETPEILPDDPEEVYSESERTGRMTRDLDGVTDGEPWWLRWRRIDGDNNKTIPDGTYEHRLTRYMRWDGEDKSEIERDEVPDEILEADGVGGMQNVADERDGEEWMIYEVSDGVRFKRRKLVPCEDFVSQRAIVIEASVAEQPSDTEFWDPNREEYTTPDDYPMGTVNVVLPEDPYKTLGEDYTYEMRVETSVVPADEGEPGSHSYTPGWE